MEVSDSCLYITYISESPLRPAPPYFKPAQKSWSASAAQLWQRIIEQWLHCQPCLTMPDGSLPVGFQVWGYLGIGSRFGVWSIVQGTHKEIQERTALLTALHISRVFAACHTQGPKELTVLVFVSRLAFFLSWAAILKINWTHSSLGIPQTTMR